MSIDYRKIESIDDFNSLIDSFVETRKALKQKVKEDRGETIATLQVGDKPLTKLEQQQAPTVKAIERLRTDLSSLKQNHSHWDLFEKYANAPDKKTSEVMARREKGKAVYKIGVSGYVNVEDVQDDLFRVVNPKTGKSMVKQLTPSLSQLLFVPTGSIDFKKISKDALLNYYDIMQFSGINPKANRNKKIKLGKKAYDNVYGKEETKEEAFTTPVKAKRRILPESKMETTVTPSQMRDIEFAMQGADDDDTDDDDTEDEEEQLTRLASLSAVKNRRRGKGMRKNKKMTKQQVIKINRETARRMLKQAKPKKRSGTGLMTIDEMVNRLHLMTQSQHAGNLSSNMQDEMMQIMDILLKKKVITKKQHKILFKKYIDY
jgi:hypothetical protein